MIDTISPLHDTQLSVAAFLKQSKQWRNSVLGAFCFSADAVENQMQADTNVPCMHVAMQRLDAGDSVCEVWHGSGQLTQGQSGAIHYRHDEDVLLGVIELPEAMFAADMDKTPLQQATESAYRQIFALLDALRYPCLFRCWNYIADITTHSFGLERYGQFNLGRQDAFLAYGRDVMGNAPAACALGFGQSTSVHGPLTTLSIAFLAGRVAPRTIENPRQISAYQYPQQYGPRSPKTRCCSYPVPPVLLATQPCTPAMLWHKLAKPSPISRPFWLRPIAWRVNQNSIWPACITRYTCAARLIWRRFAPNWRTAWAMRSQRFICRLICAVKICCWKSRPLPCIRCESFSVDHRDYGALIQQQIPSRANAELIKTIVFTARGAKASTSRSSARSSSRGTCRCMLCILTR